MSRGRFVDRVGQRIGKLVVERRGPAKPEGRAVRTSWLCRCDCGNSILVSSHSLRAAERGDGGTRSCGCLNLFKGLKHGKSGTSVYGIWHMMIQRCTNPKNSAYQSYGGRGITVCDKWMSFAGFYEDMGDRPANRTLDRIDNSKGYSKDNCRWASRLQQSNNRRTNVYYTYSGKTQTLAEWSRETGLHPQCIRSRLNSGWTVEQALSKAKLN